MRRALSLELGREGEARAAVYLERKGYRVLERNAQAGGVEIDLVVSCGPRVVFVEVKTRRSQSAGAPHEAVDARKQARLRRGAAAWLRERGRRAPAVRFDVVCCYVAGPSWRIEHWAGAF
jgi:putative endonuclease